MSHTARGQAKMICHNYQCSLYMYNYTNIVCSSIPYRLALQVTQATLLTLKLNLMEMNPKIVNIIFMYKDDSLTP